MHDEAVKDERQGADPEAHEHTHAPRPKLWSCDTGSEDYGCASKTRRTRPCVRQQAILSSSGAKYSLTVDQYVSLRDQSQANPKCMLAIQAPHMSKSIPAWSNLLQNLETSRL